MKTQEIRETLLNEIQERIIQSKECAKQIRQNKLQIRYNRNLLKQIERKLKKDEKTEDKLQDDSQKPTA